ALLARLRQLVSAARQVIIADADLDDASIQYIRELRGEDNSVFLIGNDYQAKGYSARLLMCHDRSAIIAEILDHVAAVEPGKVPFIVTDSKGVSKALARLIHKQDPTLRVLLINSETSSGELEREFMQSPDAVLERGEYDVIICSPSVATGVSIEAQGKISKVYGIFTGVSSTDADMAQALIRVRELVERVIWCANSGSNFSKVSRSTNPLELKRHLQDLTSTTISLVRSSLREDIAGAIVSYDWQCDPHVNLYARISAAQNFSMYHLREALRVRLNYEGHQVTAVEQPTNPVMKLLLRQTTQENREVEAEALVAATDLTFPEVLLLENQENPTPQEGLAVSKFYLQDFYGLETLTVEDVLWDANGRRRTEILNLEAQLLPQRAIERSIKALEKQAQWRQGYCPWDFSHIELRRQMRQVVGFDEWIEKLLQGQEWTKYDVASFAAKARALAAQIKVALNFTIHAKVSDVQILHQLLGQLGIKVKLCRWSRDIEGHAGEKLRVYGLDREHWQRVSKILERRHLQREVLPSSSNEGLERISGHGSPWFITTPNQGEDPTRHSPEDGIEVQKWLTLEVLADVRAMWRSSQTTEERDWVLATVPAQVLERAIA
ncbi:MAG: hypothetical protein LH679_19435, partial [Cyanobacteria bacterium CAN_BIN43]|nr:hypothetical protein [Cyanobacteria bacterium CAN_BIN43]